MSAKLRKVVFKDGSTHLIEVTPYYNDTYKIVDGIACFVPSVYNHFAIAVSPSGGSVRIRSFSEKIWFQY